MSCSEKTNNLELELVNQVKLGNKTAFNMLVKMHQKGVYSIVYRMVKDHDATDDVVQDTFVKAYKNILSFQGRSSFKSWLYRIAINTGKNALRTNTLSNTIDFEKVVIYNVSQKMGSEIENTQVQAILCEEIEKLPSKQKMALTLRIFDELPFKEIAEIMECPYDTAKANFRHAINSLRKQNKLKKCI